MRSETSRSRLSRFAHVYERGDYAALYHTVTMELAFLPAAVARSVRDEFADGGDAIGLAARAVDDAATVVETLVSTGHLVREGTDEDAWFRDLRDRYAADPALQVLYLILTDACNLRCSYCFEETPVLRRPLPVVQRKRRVMRPDTARAAVDAFSRLVGRDDCRKTTHFVNLYGGEPFLNMEGARAAVEAVEAHLAAGTIPSGTRITAVTNGTRIDGQIARWAAEHRVSIGVSLDGSAELTDLYRTDRHGRGVFSRALAAYRTLRDAGADVGISCTLTPESVERFDEVLDFLVKEVGPGRGFCFNTLFYSPSVKTDDAYFERAADCIVRAFAAVRKRGIYEDRAMRLATAFAERRLVYADCCVVGSQLVVAPDGRIGPCQDFVKTGEHFSASTVSDPGFDPLTDPAFLPWRRRSPLFIEGCIGCPAVAVCGGGCGASVEMQYGDRMAVDRRICPTSKKMLEWMIWDTFSRTVSGVQ